MFVWLEVTVVTMVKKVIQVPSTVDFCKLADWQHTADNINGVNGYTPSSVLHSHSVPLPFDHSQFCRSEWCPVQMLQKGFKHWKDAWTGWPPNYEICNSFLLTGNLVVEKCHMQHAFETEDKSALVSIFKEVVFLVEPDKSFKSSPIRSDICAVKTGLLGNWQEKKFFFPAEARGKVKYHWKKYNQSMCYLFPRSHP